MVDTISDVPEITGGQTFDSVSVANVFGQQGKQGIKGDKGATGAVYFPVLKDGILSWVNNGGLPNPEPIDVKTIIAVGAQGIQGIQGADGKRGEKGAPGVRGLGGETGATGKNGKDGEKGADGKDGATFKPLYDEQNGVLSWTNDGGLQNPPSVSIKGKDGKDGKNGKHGLGGSNATINGRSTLEIKAGSGILITQDSGKMTISSDIDTSGLLPKSGGAMTGVLSYAAPQVLNMQPVNAEPSVGDMVEGCIYFKTETV